MRDLCGVWKELLISGFDIEEFEEGRRWDEHEMWHGWMKWIGDRELRIHYWYIYTYT